MPYIKEVFIAPLVVEVKKYHTYQAGRKERMPKVNPTDEAHQKANERAARVKLYRYIVTNFKRDDIRIDLTYADPEPTPEEAEKRRAAFIRRLKYRYQKAGKELKAIWVAEREGHRIHHHLIVNNVGIGRDKIQECWPWATFNYRSVRFYDGSPEDALRLTEYLLKETSESVKEGKIKRRWGMTRNLEKPHVTKKKIYARSWKEMPKPKEGFQIVKLENGVTLDGFPYQFVRQFAIENFSLGRKKNGRTGKKSKGTKAGPQNRRPGRKAERRGKNHLHRR